MRFECLIKVGDGAEGHMDLSMGSLRIYSKGFYLKEFLFLIFMYAFFVY
jgi:hypothetical protein